MTAPADRQPAAGGAIVSARKALEEDEGIFEVHETPGARAAVIDAAVHDALSAAKVAGCSPADVAAGIRHAVAVAAIEQSRRITGADTEIIVGSGEARAEPAPEGLQVEIIKALDRPSLFSRRQDAQAAVSAVLAALARFRWESAAEELRLRAEIQWLLDADAEEYDFTQEVRDRLFRVLAAPSFDADALAKLAALPGKWRTEMGMTPAAQELDALLRRCGVEPAWGKR